MSGIFDMKASLQRPRIAFDILETCAHMCTRVASLRKATDYRFIAVVLGGANSSNLEICI